MWEHPGGQILAHAPAQRPQFEIRCVLTGISARNNNANSIPYDFHEFCSLHLATLSNRIIHHPSTNMTFACIGTTMGTYFGHFCRFYQCANDHDGDDCPGRRSCPFVSTRRSRRNHDQLAAGKTGRRDHSTLHSAKTQRHNLSRQPVRVAGLAEFWRQPVFSRRMFSSCTSATEQARRRRSRCVSGEKHRGWGW